MFIELTNFSTKSVNNSYLKTNMPLCLVYLFDGFYSFKYVFCHMILKQVSSLLMMKILYSNSFKNKKNCI